MDEIYKLLKKFPEKVELQSQILEEVDCDSYVRQKVGYYTEKDDWVTAYVCIPKNLKNKAPVVYCHHQHARNFELGKSEVVGLAGDPNQAYAKELAETGYITFSPDAIAFEERKSGPFQALAMRLVQGQTLMAKVIHDVQVGIDYLLTREDVDTQRIGFIGHSYGGRMALWMPTFDERIKVSVSNCCCIPYRLSLTEDTGIQMEFCIPDIMKWGDIEDIVTAAKGCPLLISATTEDEWSRGAQEVFENIKAKGKSDVELKLYGGGHIFTKEMRDYAYSFLDKYLED